jgi:hypothetical protein
MLRIHSIVIRVQTQREAPLPKVALACHGVGRLLGSRERREQQARQDGNDGDDDQQLDQRERRNGDSVPADYSAESTTGPRRWSWLDKAIRLHGSKV